MPEIELTDEIILGFVKWVQARGVSAEEASYEEIEGMIDDYMRSRVAGG
jgi:hypothetical protein